MQMAKGRTRSVAIQAPSRAKIKASLTFTRKYNKCQIVVSPRARGGRGTVFNEWTCGEDTPVDPIERFGVATRFLYSTGAHLVSAHAGAE
jgi:hypothetical protein